MDVNVLYDKKKAGEELERQVVLCRQGSHSIMPIINITEDEDWAMNYQCPKYGPVWRLVTAPQEGVPEEVVLSFQGIIYKKDIAPFNPKVFYEKPNIARFLRQNLVLCGLQTPTFEKAAKAIHQIHALLARLVGHDDLEDCSMVTKDEQGETLLHMGNRYLTPKKEIMGAVCLSLPSTVDPNGYLAHVAGQNFVYTDDNQIHYWERRRIPGTDDIKVGECSPVIFQVGDVVEAQVTFIVIGMRDGRKKAAMVLRSLLLLDGSITHKSMVANIMRRDDVPKVDRPLKRRVGYEEQEGMHKGPFEEENDPAKRPTFKRRLGYNEEVVTETTKRMSDMDIDPVAGPSKRTETDSLD